MNKLKQLFSSFDMAVMSVTTIITLCCIIIFSYSSNFYILAVPFIGAMIAWAILNWKSLYWFFLVLIPLSPFVPVGESLWVLPQLPMMFLMSGIVLFVLLYNRKRLSDAFVRHPLIAVIFLQLAWLVIAVLYSTNQWLSFKYLIVNILQLTCFLILPALIIKSKEDLFKAYKLFVIPIILIAIVAFIRHYFTNFGFRESNEVCQPFFYNHVDYSTILSMVFPVLLVAYQLTPKDKIKQRWLLIGIILFMMVAIYVAFARAAMLAVMFAIAVAVAMRWNLGKWIMPLFFLFAVSIVVYLVYDNNYISFRPQYTQTYTRKDFHDLIKATFTGGDMSSMERFYRWIASARMSVEEPITGVGPNNWYFNYKPHTVTMFKTYVSRNPERSTTHNYFIFMLVEQGIAALVLYATLLIVAFNRAQNIYNRTTDIFYRRICIGAIMIIAAFFMNNLFSELLQTYKIGAFFYLAIVTLIWVDYKTKNIVEQEKSTLP